MQLVCTGAILGYFSVEGYYNDFQRPPLVPADQQQQQQQQNNSNNNVTLLSVYELELEGRREKNRGRKTMCFRGNIMVVRGHLNTDSGLIGLSMN